jgi:hypothetical protein
MWALRRRILILCTLVLVCAVIIFVPIVIRNAVQKPSCSDTIQNGRETGIDCGGVCARMCFAEQKPISVVWSRILPIDDDVYTGVFLVENQNFTAFAYRVPYTCSVAGADYAPLGSFSGFISVPPSGRYASVYTPFVVKTGTPDKIQCAIAREYTLLQLPKKANPNPFRVESIELDSDRLRPRVTAKMYSVDKQRLFSDTKFVVSVYDAEDNLAGASITSVPRISFGKEYGLVYTWPNQFTGTAPYRVDITPLFEFPEYEALSL